MKHITISLVLRMILTYVCTLAVNSLGERKFSHFTDIPQMITRQQEPQKILWVGDHPSI